MKFLVDLPLGGLAKWLRFCGFDAQVLHLSPGDPKTLPPPQPGTVILTRHAALVRGRVPEHVFHYQSQFHECPHCHRLFWAGSHLSGIIKTVLEKLADNKEGG